MDEGMIIKYLQGQCSREEEALLLEWLQQSSENKDFFLEQKAVFNYRKAKHFAIDDQINAAAGRFNANIDAFEVRRKRQVYLRIARYAAILIFALALPAILYKAHVFSGDAKLITMSVGYTDSSKLVLLSDGSRVWLNSNSSISYPETFSKNDRNVQFTGEAYFEVTHDSLHPFKVQTNNMQVKVLGTSFNVRSYHSEKITETTLIEGKVSIQNEKGNNLATLTPGQSAQYDNTTRDLEINVVDTKQYAAWRHGLILFNDATLDEITQRLSELYQVHFTIESKSLENATYNFSFQKGQSVSKVLEMLSFIAPIKYTIQGKEIRITPA
jgi:transmembrane sensor